MKEGIELALGRLDKAVHEEMVKAAKAFEALGIEEGEDAMESTAGVIIVLQHRLSHAVGAYLGAMLEGGVSVHLVRTQTGLFKDSASSAIDLAAAQAISQHALEKLSEGEQ